MSFRVVLEGVPGAGKTTLGSHLARALRSPLIPEFVVLDSREWRQHRLRAPFYRVNEELKEAAANVFETPIVVLDRHYVGPLAFAYALMQYDPQRSALEPYDSELAWYKESLSSGRLSKPGCVILLDIPPAMSCARQPRATAFDIAFGSEIFLGQMGEYYRLFYRDVEIDTPTLWLDGSANIQQLCEAAVRFVHLVTSEPRK